MPSVPGALHHGAGEHVLGIDGALQGVVLLGDDPREHRLGDRDERNRVGHLEQREAGRRRGGDQGARRLVVAEPQPEPQPCQPRLRPDA